MTLTPQWIGPLGDHRVGDRGFLIKKYHYTKQWTRYEISDTAPLTNQSFESRLYGWCGSYNDVSTTACGAVEVAKVAANGRLLVRWLEGEQLAEMLEEFGFPELIGETAA